MRGEEIVNEGATRGSAVHRVLELLDFKKYVSMDKTEMSDCLQQDMEQMVAEGRLSEEYKNLIFRGKIVEFLCSDLAKRMAQAQEKNRLFKEQPFIMAVSASLLKEEYPETEKVLIQGIVDVYFEEEDGLVIVDYKTDRVDSLEQLKERYKTQLDYYEEAIGRLTGRNVKEKIMYSFALADIVSWK
jgi:ATP-dependent helicase/nuclease subunit A